MVFPFLVETLCYLTSWPKASKQVTCTRRGRSSGAEQAGEIYWHLQYTQTRAGKQIMQGFICASTLPPLPQALYKTIKKEENIAVWSIWPRHRHMCRGRLPHQCVGIVVFTQLSHFFASILCSSLHYKMVAAEIRPSSKRCFRHGVSPNTYFLF